MLNPTLDLVCKLLFAPRHDLIVSLLTAVLKPPVPIQSVEVINPGLEQGDDSDRGAVLDLRVTHANGTQLDVALQSRTMGPITGMLHHWARRYTSQILLGSEFESLRPYVCVLILDYQHQPSNRFHSTFGVIEVHNHKALSDQFQFHLVELPKLPAPGSIEATSEPELMRWARFFRARTDEEFEKLAATDPIIRKAVDGLKELSSDAKVQQLAREREQACAQAHPFESVSHR